MAERIPRRAFIKIISITIQLEIGFMSDFCKKSVCMFGIITAVYFRICGIFLFVHVSDSVGERSVSFVLQLKNTVKAVIVLS